MLNAGWVAGVGCCIVVCAQLSCVWLLLWLLFVVAVM